MSVYKVNRNNDTEKIIEIVKTNPSFEKMKVLLGRLMGEFCYFVIPHADPISSIVHEANIPECRECHISESPSICKSEMMAAVLRASEKRVLQQFICNQGQKGIVHPIVQGDRIYGYLVVCSVKEDVPADLFDIFTAFTSTILEAAQKELELKKLYETIRPRAIALSTVHTLHRLISSTLDLSELLPRVARLTLQVMRANRCSIKLVDSKKKTLLPKATVDLRAKIAKLKKVEIGKWAPGKAVKYGRPIRGESYLATPLIDEDTIGVITVYDRTDSKPFTNFDEEIMKTLCEQAVIAIKNAQLYKEQERLTVGSIKSIAAILETKAPGTYLPKASFLKLVRLVGVELRLSEYELKCLEYASLLHDAGQIAVPDKVTKKRGTLTGKEYDLIKEHPKTAAAILKPLKSLKNIVPIILHHHENFDGTGYPMRLKGNDIPLGARIMGVVGAFEAMITRKPYRKPLAIVAALDEIRKNAGKQFDPLVVHAFLNVVKRKDILKMLRKEIYGHRKAGV